jgi:predicted nucleic acid-binding protein
MPWSASSCRKHYRESGGRARQRIAWSLLPNAGPILKLIPDRFGATVQEFYAAGSRKLGMPHRELQEAVLALLDIPLVIVGPAQITAARATEQRYRISFGDALILAAAESGRAGVLFTEDLSDGQLYGSVTVSNPFLAPEKSSPVRPC